MVCYINIIIIFYNSAWTFLIASKFKHIHCSCVIYIQCTVPPPPLNFICFHPRLLSLQRLVREFTTVYMIYFMALIWKICIDNQHIYNIICKPMSFENNYHWAVLLWIWSFCKSYHSHFLVTPTSECLATAQNSKIINDT